MMDRAAALSGRGRAPMVPARLAAGWPGRCNRVGTGRTGLLSASAWCAPGRVPPSRLRSFPKAPGFTVSWFRVFTVPTQNYSGINLR